MLHARRQGPPRDFELLDQDETAVKLSGLRGHKVLVYFYPKADTPGCTKQACGLNDVLGDVGDTVILGVSPDKPSKQAQVRPEVRSRLPAPLRPRHSTAEAFDVWKEKSMYGRKYLGIERSAFLIDEQGKVADAWYKVSPADTPKNLLAALLIVHVLEPDESRPAEVLPHRPPFLFVDEVTRLEPGRQRRARGRCVATSGSSAGTSGAADAAGRVDVRSDRPGRRHRRAHRRALRRQAAAVRRSRRRPLPAPGRSRRHVVAGGRAGPHVGAGGQGPGGPSSVDPTGRSPAPASSSSSSSARDPRPTLRLFHLATGGARGPRRRAIR